MTESKFYNIPTDIEMVEIKFYGEDGFLRATTSLALDRSTWDVGEFKQFVVNNQNCLEEDWVGQYFVLATWPNGTSHIFSPRAFKYYRKDI